MKFETTSGTVDIPKDEVAKFLLAVCEKRTGSLNARYADTDEDSYATRGEIRDDLATVARARRDALAGNLNRAFVELYLDMADAARALGLDPARTTGNDLLLPPGMAIDELDAEISSLRLSRYLAHITQSAREDMAYSILQNRPVQYLDQAEREDHEFALHRADEIDRDEEWCLRNGFTRSRSEFWYPLGWDPSSEVEYQIVSFLDQPEPDYRLRTRVMEYEQDPEEALGNMIWVDRFKWVTDQKFQSPRDAIHAVFDHVRHQIDHQADVPTGKSEARNDDKQNVPIAPDTNVALYGLLGPGGAEILAEANARAQRLGLSSEASDAMRDLAMDNVYAESAAAGRRASLEALAEEDRRERQHPKVPDGPAASQRSIAAHPKTESIADLVPPLPSDEYSTSKHSSTDLKAPIGANERRGDRAATVAPHAPFAQAEPTLTLYRAQATKSLTPQAKAASWLDDSPIVQNTFAAAGRWFSADRSETEWYIKNEYFDGADVIAVILPARVAEQYRVSNLPPLQGGKDVADNPHAYSLRPETEFFLPREIAATATPVATGITWPKDIVTSAPGRVLKALREVWLDSGGTGDPSALEAIRSRTPAEYHALVATNPGEKPLQPLVSVTDGKITLSCHGVEFVNAAIEADPRNGIAQEVAAFYGVPRTSKAPPSTPRREIRAEPASPGPSSTPEIDPMR